MKKIENTGGWKLKNYEDIFRKFSRYFLTYFNFMGDRKKSPSLISCHFLLFLTFLTKSAKSLNNRFKFLIAIFPFILINSRICNKKPLQDDNRIGMVYFSDRREVKRATEATDGRFLFSAIIDVYDQTLSEKQ